MTEYNPLSIVNDTNQLFPILYLSTIISDFVSEIISFRLQEKNKQMFAFYMWAFKINRRKIDLLCRFFGPEQVS